MGLLFKHENLSSDPQYWCKHLVWWYMPVTLLLRGGGGGRIDGACWPSSLTKISSSRFSERACLKNVQWSVTGEVIRCGSLASTYIHMYRYVACLCTHARTPTHRIITTDFQASWVWLLLLNVLNTHLDYSLFHILVGAVVWLWSVLQGLSVLLNCRPRYGDIADCL